MKNLGFKITEDSYNIISPYLHGKECKVAIALCGQKIGGTSHLILFHKLVAVHEIDGIAEKLDNFALSANEKAHAILLIHSFTEKNSIDPLVAKLSSSFTCASLFLEDNKLKGYVYSKNIASPFTKFSFIGDDIRFELEEEALSAGCSDFTNRHAQCLGEGTAFLLRKITVGIVGVSGTGSIVTELLARLGVARMLLVDPDLVEECNLNRVINSKRSDIGKFKTEVAAEAIRNMNLGVEVKPISLNLSSIEAVSDISECDVVFGCMDSSEGRHILNRMATFYIIPYFDVGIRIDADGKGGINKICGSIHYIKPGGSSLLSRGVLDDKQIRAEGLRRTNPEDYQKLLNEKYIKGVQVESPAVISINAFYSSMAVNEFLARLHGNLRSGGNINHDSICFDMTEEQLYIDHISPEKNKACPSLLRHVGKGDVEPLLERSELTRISQ